MSRIALPITLAAGVALLAACTAFPTADVSRRPLVLEPARFGPYATATACPEIDLAKLAAAKSAGIHPLDYGRGSRVADGSLRYVTDLLPAGVEPLRCDVDVPSDSANFGAAAGKKIPYILLVVYPTVKGDKTPSREFMPGYPGFSLPAALPAGKAPRFPDNLGRCPVLVFGHGGGTDPLSFLYEMNWFASRGYVVVAPFYGDERFSMAPADNARVAMRALATRAALEAISRDARFAPHLDLDRAGAYGVSFGGFTAATATGAKLFGAIDAGDTRFRAGVGLIPYLSADPERHGRPLWGERNTGCAAWRAPYLAVCGELDTVCPLAGAYAALVAAPGSKYLVRLAGQIHNLDALSRVKSLTWATLFLDAHVKGDPEAKDKLARARGVKGEPGDELLLTR